MGEEPVDSRCLTQAIHVDRIRNEILRVSAIEVDRVRHGANEIGRILRQKLP